jgi:Domain of unknown function (DUF5060)/Protein of unknown function (DUF4038)
MHFSHSVVLSAILLSTALVSGAEPPAVARYHVLELNFHGPVLTSKDSPARDVELAVTFRHESGGPGVTVQGFWDGDGKGGNRGDVFKVRFCPAKAGRWQVVQTTSNHAKLQGQHEGETIVCTESRHPGFWLVEGRWYCRSDGSHPYLVGNTHYSFLSGRTDQGPTGTTPAEDVRASARFYRKLRFTLMADRYPDPGLKPFLDDQGRQTDDGRFSFRPNPAWFNRRADPAVAAGHAEDLVCDLILCGPDTSDSRSTLTSDPKPWLRYVAARYGSYPNVWFCLCNEWNIKKPHYTAAQIREAGQTLKRYLSHPTPLSVHGKPHDWDRALNGDWCDHVIIQSKQKKLDRAADVTARNYTIGGRKPVVNDENAYEGRGDAFSTLDTIEGCLGTFLGGGYPTTGFKPAAKKGHYFWGRFRAEEHRASDSLLYLRQTIDRSINFWKLAPRPLKDSPFRPLPDSFRLLGSEAEYVLGSNTKAENLRVALPPGTWRVTQIDLVERTTRALSASASGLFTFSTPESRAVLTHFLRTGKGK